MLIHYILVRRDLPFGVTLAQVAHAAADSIAEWTMFRDPTETTTSDYINLVSDVHSTVVVLGVRNLKRLRKYAYKLKAKGVPFTEVREPDMPWNGQLMALGIYPGKREDLEPLFKDLQTYREFNQVEVPIE